MVMKYLEQLLKLRAPKDTGNLSSFAISYDLNTLTITIGGGIVDYALYTNEPWLSDKWNGRTNPNQGWVESTIAEATPNIISILSGAISQEEANFLIGYTTSLFERNFYDVVTAKQLGGKTK